MAKYGDLYDHGIDMASEIPSSEKSDGFNQYWKVHGSGSKKLARKAYNKGWADYKSGNWEPSGSPLPSFFLLVGTVGVAIWWFFIRKKSV